MVKTIKSGEAIVLDAPAGKERLQQWAPYRRQGYRILDEDGVTVWHEAAAIKRIVLRAFEKCDADIFLFGSRASGEEHTKSDYDIGFNAPSSISADKMAELCDSLEELPIPSRVELVDFEEVPVEFKQITIGSGKVEIWKKRSKNSLFT